MIKKILNFINGEDTKTKNHMFDASLEHNSDEAIIRAMNSVKLLSGKIENLLDELKQTNFENMNEKEIQLYKHDIIVKIEIIDKFIKTLHLLALNLVNNPKYKENKDGAFLNTHFLSIMNKIKTKNLIFNNHISEKILISQLTEIKFLLNEIKLKN